MTPTHRLLFTNMLTHPDMVRNQIYQKSLNQIFPDFEAHSAEFMNYLKTYARRALIAAI